MGRVRHRLVGPPHGGTPCIRSPRQPGPGPDARPRRVEAALAGRRGHPGRRRPGLADPDGTASWRQPAVHARCHCGRRLESDRGAAPSSRRRARPRRSHRCTSGWFPWWCTTPWWRSRAAMSPTWVGSPDGTEVRWRRRRPPPPTEALRAFFPASATNLAADHAASLAAIDADGGGQGQRRRRRRGGRNRPGGRPPGRRPQCRHPPRAHARPGCPGSRPLRPGRPWSPRGRLHPTAVDRITRTVPSARPLRPRQPRVHGRLRGGQGARLRDRYRTHARPDGDRPLLGATHPVRQYQDGLRALVSERQPHRRGRSYVRRRQRRRPPTP